MLARRLARYISITIMLAFLEFVIILFIPLVNLEGTALQRMAAYILAAAFWISIATEFFMVKLCTYERRWLERRGYRNKGLRYSKPGIFSFFKSTEAVVADIVLFLSIIIVGISVCMQIKTEWMIMGGISILVLSFNLHCILNGRNYRYIKKYKKEQEQDEQNKG